MKNSSESAASPEVARSGAADFVTSSIDVLASPGQVFERMSVSKPSHTNWLIPLLCYCLVTTFLFLRVTQQPQLREQLLSLYAASIAERDQQGKGVGAIAKAFDEKERAAILLQIGGSVTLIASTCIWTFWTACVLWLISGWLSTEGVSFRKVLGAVGMSINLLIVATVATHLLIWRKSDIHARPEIFGINFFEVWLVIILMVAVAKLSGTTLRRAGLAVGCYWGLFQMVMKGLM